MKIHKGIVAILCLTQFACSFSAANPALPTDTVTPPAVQPSPSKSAFDSLATALPPTVIPGGLFSVVALSAQVISPGCAPNSVRFDVTPIRSDISGVILFHRLRYKVSGDRTIWDAGVAMKPNGKDFTLELKADSIKGFDQFNEPVAWVQFQLVALGTNGKVIGRTTVFAEKLTISSICP